MSDTAAHTPAHPLTAAAAAYLDYADASFPGWREDAYMSARILGNASRR